MPRILHFRFDMPHSYLRDRIISIVSRRVRLLDPIELGRIAAAIVRACDKGARTRRAATDKRRRAAISLEMLQRTLYRENSCIAGEDVPILMKVLRRVADR